MGSNLPIVLIELVLVFGGVLAFGWWQLRSIEKDREAARRRREAQGGTPAPASQDDATRPPSPPSASPPAPDDTPRP